MKINYPAKLWQWVDAMIQGLKEPGVIVNMDDFGSTDGKVCFGCAATNAVCRITGIKPTPEMFSGIHFNLTFRIEGLSLEEEHTLEDFESAIDLLRLGTIRGFWTIACQVNPKFKESEEAATYNEWLPELWTDNYIEGLPEYEAYRDWLKEQDL